MFIISIISLIISKILKRNVEKTREKYRIQQGQVQYNDLIKAEKALFSKRYRIAGKPDYIVKNNNRYIPVEFKTGNHDYPLKNHVMQLAAYCQLIEENYNDFVPYGILVYNRDSEFKIPFNPRTRYDLENTIKKIRYAIKTGDVTLNHNDPNRCRACSMRNNCDKKII